MTTTTQPSLATGWYRWRRIEDEAGLGRRLLEVFWLTDADELRRTTARIWTDDVLSIEEGDTPCMADELMLLDELAREVRLDERTPSRALWHADRQRTSDAFDERIARWELGRAFSRVETLLQQLTAEQGAARAQGGAA